jgi:hypothetical protein
MMLAKVLYMGLQDPCHLGREGKNLISLQRRRFSILMRWKIRGDQPGIFSMGVRRNFLVLLLTHVYVFFIVTSLTLGKSFVFFTHMFTLQTIELINPAKFISIYIIELHHNTNVCIHQAKLFVFLILTKSLFIHMHVPSSSLVRQVCFPSLWFLWLHFTFYTHASSLQP